VISGTSHDLARLIDIEVSVAQVQYELKHKNVTLDSVLNRQADVPGSETLARGVRSLVERVVLLKERWGRPCSPSQRRNWYDCVR